MFIRYKQADKQIDKYIESDEIWTLIVLLNIHVNFEGLKTPKFTSFYY